MDIQQNTEITNATSMRFASPSVLRRVEKTIWITFALPGIHRYPDAPEEVAYLRELHRHMFHFKVGMTVAHSNREVEFHMLKNWCVGLYKEGTLQLDYKSCEMMAEDLLTKLADEYGNERVLSVEVSEDQECGAIVTWSPANIR